MNHLPQLTGKPAFQTTRTRDGSRDPSREPARHPLPIFDARGLEPAPSLDREGFVLEHLHSAVSNAYDPDEVRAVYYAEVAELVKRATGATRVEVFDHNVRNATMAARRENAAQMPVKFAHNDYTLRSGPQRVRDLFPDEADALLQERFAVINVWKPIRGPVQDTPLAVCDAQSIRPEDLIASDLKYEDRTGEVYSLAYNARQRWFYFSQMQADEAMLIKCYDSASDGRARFTCHSAFRDPTAPGGAEARESIEVRTLAFFGG